MRWLAVIGVLVVVAVLAVGLATVVMRRRHLQDPGSHDVVVRCSRGHLYTTIWVPGVSFKAVRLGLRRYQHCPVGHHWAIVTPVASDRLSDAERAEAARVHDIGIP
jgi:hypothetical protein